MLIGRGSIAEAIIDRPDLLFFAAGVSNSGETRESEYRRELELLLKQDKSSHLVYFSSLAVFYSQTRYATHKLFMESIIKHRFRLYTIFRLGNIDWGENAHTLINHLREQKRLGKPLDIQDTYRYVINNTEFQHWMTLIPPWSCEMNCPGQMMTVQEIVDKYV